MILDANDCAIFRPFNQNFPCTPFPTPLSKLYIVVPTDILFIFEVPITQAFGQDDSVGIALSEGRVVGR